MATFRKGDIIVCLEDKDCTGCVGRVVLARRNNVDFDVIRKSVADCRLKEGMRCHAFPENDGETWAKIGITNHKLGKFYE